MKTQPSFPGMTQLAPRPSKQAGYKRANSEFDEQCELFKFLRTFAHLAPEFGLVHASLNGIFLPFAKLKADAEKMGMVAGVWDVCVPIPRYHPEGNRPNDGVLYSALYVEMKTETGDLTKNQAKFMDTAVDHSLTDQELICRPRFLVCRSWIEAARAIVDYLQITDTRILEALK